MTNKAYSNMGGWEVPQGNASLPIKPPVRSSELVGLASLNQLEAKCCCACAHWHKHGFVSGQCRNPKMRHGVTYKDKNTSEETHIEWWTTGCYYSCLNWTERKT
jgi:hypothetical protein